MAYTLTRPDNRGSITITDDTINTITGLELVGQSKTEYGGPIASNFLLLLENFHNTVSPDDTAMPGQLWFDAGENRLKVNRSVDDFSPDWDRVAGLDLDLIEADVISAQAAIGILQADVITAQAEVDAVEILVSTTQGDVTTVTNTVTAVNTEVNNIESASGGVFKVDGTWDSTVFGGVTNIGTPTTLLLALSELSTAIDSVSGAAFTSFVNLNDTPANFTGGSLKYVRVNSGQTALEFVNPAFLELADTPSSYVGQTGKALRVNGAAVAFEDIDFHDLTGVPASSGTIAQILVQGVSGLDWANNIASLVDLLDNNSGAYSGHAGEFIKVSALEDGFEFAPLSTTFLGLTDTPGTFGAAGQRVVVNPAGNGLIFETIVAGPTPSLNDLTNVLTDGGSADKFLAWGNPDWTPVKPALSKLAETIITSPSTDDILAFFSGAWRNRTLTDLNIAQTGGSASDITDLADIGGILTLAAAASNVVKSVSGVITKYEIFNVTGGSSLSLVMGQVAMPSPTGEVTISLGSLSFASPAIFVVAMYLTTITDDRMELNVTAKASGSFTLKSQLTFGSPPPTIPVIWLAIGEG